MKLFATILVIVCACVTQAQTNNKKEYLIETMIPLARDFIARNALRFDTNFGTNAVKKYTIDCGDVGCGATLFLTNGWAFSYLSDRTNTEVFAFHTGTKSDYFPSRMSNAELQAVKALNLRNKLTNKKALEIAKWHFRVMGHKEKDFHPPEFWQLGGDPGVPDYFPVPLYKATWYRKDVNVEADSAAGKLMPQIQITISGITTNIIDYDKGFMPIGRDIGKRPP